ncbi:MAG: hypothetical protein U0T59_01655 [Buchnera aphidicola (Meitanaphis flavogallis)]
MLTDCNFLFKKNFLKDRNHTRFLLKKYVFIDLLNFEKVLKNDLLKKINNINIPFQDNLILVNEVNNNTIYEINTNKIQDIFINFFNKEISCFNVAQKSNIKKAKKNLNISSKDILINRNKALMLAKKINVNYLLYNSIYEKHKQLYMQLQIIVVNSKEIILEDNMLIGKLEN